MSSSSPLQALPRLGKRVWNSPWFFWMLLIIPSIGFLIGPLSGGSVHRYIHPTGEFSARFMIFAMMISPLRAIFPNSRIVFWLLPRRRYLGVAAFGYAVLHTLYYLIDIKWNAASIYNELLQTGISTGWIAFILFVPLALTSNNLSVKRLANAWKPLQRWVYLAAVMTFIHWLLITKNPGGALVHFGFLGVLEVARISIWAYRQKKPTPQPSPNKPTAA